MIHVKSNETLGTEKDILLFRSPIMFAEIKTENLLRLVTLNLFNDFHKELLIEQVQNIFFVEDDRSIRMLKN